MANLTSFGFFDFVMNSLPALTLVAINFEQINLYQLLTTRIFYRWGIIRESGLFGFP